MRSRVVLCVCSQKLLQLRRICQFRQFCRAHTDTQTQTVFLLGWVARAESRFWRSREQHITLPSRKKGIHITNFCTTPRHRTSSCVHVRNSVQHTQRTVDVFRQVLQPSQLLGHSIPDQGPRLPEQFGSRQAVKTTAHDISAA